MILEFFLLAFAALRANKTRSLLSMLGVIIGVSTVILVVGIGMTAQNIIADQFKNLSADSIMVAEDGINSNVSFEDVEFVLEKAKYISSGIPSVRGSASASYSSFSSGYGVFGVRPGFFTFSNLVVLEGRLLSDEELLTYDKKVVIGDNIADDLRKEYPGATLIGESIFINKKKFEIVGILKENGNSGPAISYDKTLFMPYEVADKTILGASGQTLIIFLGTSVKTMKESKEELIRLMRESHDLKEWEEDDFRLFDAGNLVASAQLAAKVLTYLLLSVASIILLVSGIGIMNVMFVVVAERTKEIGVMKAVGAPQRIILLQFLLESVMLSVLGGIIGILIGIGLITLINIPGFVTIPLSFGWMIIAFFFSVGVGIFFGWYPALKASQLDPVDALRSE